MLISFTITLIYLCPVLLCFLLAPFLSFSFVLSMSYFLRFSLFSITFVESSLAQLSAGNDEFSFLPVRSCLEAHLLTCVLFSLSSAISSILPSDLVSLRSWTGCSGTGHFESTYLCMMCSVTFSKTAGHTIRFLRSCSFQHNLLTLD